MKVADLPAPAGYRWRATASGKAHLLDDGAGTPGRAVIDGRPEGRYPICSRYFRPLATPPGPDRECCVACARMAGAKPPTLLDQVRAVIGHFGMATLRIYPDRPVAVEWFVDRPNWAGGRGEAETIDAALRLILGREGRT